MDQMKRLQEAAKRWEERADHRHGRDGAAADPLARETPRRLKLRIKHLSEVATKNSNKPQPAERLGVPSMLDQIGQERVIDKSDFLDINFLETAIAVSRSTCRVIIKGAGGQTLGYGTGFMVSPRLMLTNNHVLETADTAKCSIAQFDYQYDRSGQLKPAEKFKLDPATFYLTDVGLDCTLVAVSEVSEEGTPLAQYGWSRLLGVEGKAVIGESLNIIQHPLGEPKQIVLRSNELVDVLDNHLHYVTDTEQGASGSAVYNDQWEVVALHHSGVAARDGNDNLLTATGQIWRPAMGETELKWVANEGVRVSSLVKFIREVRLQGSQAQLRDELLNAEPPAPLELARRVAEPNLPIAGGPAVRFDIPSHNLSIPITVHLEVGQPFSDAPPARRPSAILPAVKASPVDEALAELERASQRPYYDEQSDRVAAAAYYADLAPNADPNSTFVAISAWLAETHATKLSYSPSRHVYPWVDLQPGSPPSLASIYSGKKFDPREFIEADRAIDQRRAQLRETLAAQAVLGRESQLLTDEFLEASLPYNCEHVVPQSWFAKREPMRGDLHHLFACESGCNSFRGNIPYFDFADFNEVVRSDCGKREEGKFEPGANKGAVARATLYFLMRYPGQINRSSKEYTEDRIATLLDWHTSSPPTVYEKHRNAAIFELQGNRNPLIDHPEWASKIAFKRGLG